MRGCDYDVFVSYARSGGAAAANFGAPMYDWRELRRQGIREALTAIELILPIS
jgi:hypothetical protein